MLTSGTSPLSPHSCYFFVIFFSLLSQFLLLGIVLDICWLPGSVIHHLVFSLFIFILNRKCFLQSLTLSIVMIYSIHCFKKYFGNHIFNFQGFFLVLWLLLYLNVRPETIKLLEENIGKTLSDIHHSRILYDPPPRILEVKAKKTNGT